MPYGLTPIYTGLRPYETIRYSVDVDGRLIGYVSNFYYDSRVHWVAWRDDGLKQETGSRKRAVATLLESGP